MGNCGPCTISICALLNSRRLKTRNRNTFIVVMPYLVHGGANGGGEAQEAQGVASGRGIEHNHVVVHGLHLRPGGELLVERERFDAE